MNKDIITMSDLEPDLVDERKRLRAKYSGEELNRRLAQKEYDVLNKLIDQKLQLQEAEAKAIDGERGGSESGSSTSCDAKDRHSPCGFHLEKTGSRTTDAGEASGFPNPSGRDGDGFRESRNITKTIRKRI